MIALEADRRGNSVTRETLRSDTTTVERLEWDVLDANCRKQSFVVIYDNQLRRKYWLSKGSQTLRATGYVDELGGKADTLMYFYERVP
ncbi:perphorin family protein [Telluribacter sp. SYSU D00476]|uniref:perphorin family protein n=1 Tax=Telluribacter sp. SYSU D00476 TaxID=2811430 RepID=UPI001FF416BB|nr:perphorin family protein [Telluribacter sp. SYSU D00476]